MDEIWKDIPDYENMYQASTLGRMRSLNRVDSLGRPLKGKILNPVTNKKGYQRVQLRKDGNVKNFFVHRLIWLTFNGEIPHCMQVNHINENKTDNRLENLNLMTPMENCNFGTRNERMAKAQSKQVIGYNKNGDVVITFPSISEAGRNGYSQGNISECCNGRRPRHKGLHWRYANGDC